MSDWSDGYVQNIDYTFGYYSVMNPARVKFAFSLAGLAAPEISTCCELGFGNGITINIHNAASPNQWHGNDFNPGQLLFAEEIAREAGCPLNLCDDSFEEYDARHDLPMFDFIALHGIWTYVSPENRAFIVAFIKKKLKPGGVVYVSYNLLTGWARFLPVRNLMTSLQQDFSSQVNHATNPISEALGLIDRLVDVKAKYLAEDAVALHLFNDQKKQNIDYVAHEFFGKNWNLMNFSDCSAELSHAKLSYACSANYMDHLASLTLTIDQQALLKSTSSVTLKEDMRDFILNRRFRMDYWVKGALPLKPELQLKLLNEQRVILSVHPEDIARHVNDLKGISSIDPSVYSHVFNAMGDFKIHTLGELAARLSAHNIGLVHVIHATMAMIQRGYAMVAQDDAAIEAAMPHATRFNAHVLQRARTGTEQAHKSGREISYLASPVSGGGFNISRIEQLFLAATAEGMATPQELGAFAAGILATIGEKLEIEGKALNTEAETATHLTALASVFLAKVLPAIKGLRMV